MCNRKRRNELRQFMRVDIFNECAKQPPVPKRIKVVRCEMGAMVHDAAVCKIVRANLFATLRRSDLCLRGAHVLMKKDQFPRTPPPLNKQNLPDGGGCLRDDAHPPQKRRAII